MREADRATIRERGVASLVLMENAAVAVTRVLAEMAPELAGEKVLVLCGKGNNGGDGLAVARQLLQLCPGLDLRVALLAPPDGLSPDALANWRMLQAQDFRPSVCATAAAWSAMLPEVSDATLIVDAILGTGVSGPARGVAARVIGDVNARFRNARVVAVDMPSGLPSDSGAVSGPAMRVDRTVTFTAPKASQVLPPACDRVGRLSVARIGTADSVLDGLPGPRLLLAGPEALRWCAAPRARSAHKGSFGHVLAIGGSRTKPGAILMTGMAALRAGAGLVTVFTAEGSAQAMIGRTPELMVETGEPMPDGTLGPDALDPSLLDGKTVAAIGPGLGTGEANRDLAARVIGTCPLPLVVDADALAAVPRADIARRTAPTVLTPHPGEMARLAGMSVAAVQRDRLAVARRLARECRTHVVLKGNRTLIAAPDGDTVVNPTGTPAMATAGSGDILTGIVAAFLGQFPRRSVLEAVAAATYLHGLAGEMAVRKHGELGVLATDLAACLASAVDAVRE